MLIGFDGSRAFSQNRTGTEEYSYQLLKALSKIDHKNHYIVYLRPGTKGDAFQGWSDNFKFSVLDFNFLWTQGGLALQTFKDNLDVLFVPSHTLPIIRKPGLKTVVTVHDLGSEYLPQTHQLKQRLYLGLMQRFQLKTATKLIAVSKATKEDLVKRIGIDQDRIKVVYEGYDESLYRKLSIDTIVNSLRQYKLKPQNYFLFVGTVQPRKNLERVIEAFAILLSFRGAKRRGNLDLKKIATVRCDIGSRNDNVNLVIVGQKGWMSDEIYSLPKQLGIEDRVKFLGYVPDKDLPALYSGAIAFVYPSLFEGFGLPILEAQACGCPVITSNVSSMPEVACLPAGPPAGGGAILVDPYSVEEIARGMEKLEDRRWRMEIIKNGFENIKRFSWEKCARETLEVLNACV